jgi:hypothetical protein
MSNNVTLSVNIDGAAIRQSVADHLVNIAREITGVPAEPASPMTSTAANLEWSPTLCDSQSVKYKAAEKAIEAMNAKLGDNEPRWRIPTRIELESILDLTRFDPAVDPERFPGTKSGYYWTSTPLASGPSDAWIVSFSYGGVSVNHRGNNYAFVRAVRSVPAGQ